MPRSLNNLHLLIQAYERHRNIALELAEAYRMLGEFEVAHQMSVQAKRLADQKKELVLEEWRGYRFTQH